MATHSSILAWRIPLRSLVGYSPRGLKELYMTEQLTLSLPDLFGRHKPLGILLSTLHISTLTFLILVTTLW